MPPTATSQKRRTREHVIADLSVNHDERFALRVGFAVHRVHHDYGIDLEVSTFNRRSEVEPGLIHIQVKADRSHGAFRRGKLISLPIDGRDLRAWMDQLHPVILVIFDAQLDRAYWVHVQKYFSSIWSEGAANIKAFRTVRIPMANRLKENAILKFAAEKNRIYERSEGWTPYGR